MILNIKPIVNMPIVKILYFVFILRDFLLFNFVVVHKIPLPLAAYSLPLPKSY